MKKSQAKAADRHVSEANLRRDRAIADVSEGRGAGDRERISVILSALSGKSYLDAQELMAMSMNALQRLLVCPDVEPIRSEESDGPAH